MVRRDDYVYLVVWVDKGLKTFEVQGVFHGPDSLEECRKLASLSLVQSWGTLRVEVTRRIMGDDFRVNPANALDRYREVMVQSGDWDIPGPKIFRTRLMQRFSCSKQVGAVLTEVWPQGASNWKTWRRDRP